METMKIDNTSLSKQDAQFVTEKHELVIANKPNQAHSKDMLGLPINTLESKKKSNTLNLETVRIKNAHWAFSTRRVQKPIASTLILPKGAPKAGDLVLARVDALGHHTKLQLANGRRKQMFIDDEIVVAYGNRYAANQFEAFLPETLGPCHLVAGGGLASRAVSWHARIVKGPTHITPIGLLADANGERINLKEFALSPIGDNNSNLPTTIAVVGTGMDSGKTQSAAYLVKGLTTAGLKVGYAKITGTGAGGDTWLLTDAGADPVLDFTDVGYPSTYMLSTEEIDEILVTLIQHVAKAGVDAIVIEIADGVFQKETASLLQLNNFSSIVGGVLFAARDSMGASAGVQWINNNSIPVVALSGVLSAAPLSKQEANAVLNLPIYDRQELATSKIALSIVGRAWQRLKNVNSA